ILRNGPVALHGRARWASEREIKAAGLRGTVGLLCGKSAGRFLTFGGSEHMMVYAPTRSGKGVGIVVPNLLNWADSCIVSDIKKENWNLTAGFRAAHGQQVFLFDPLEPNGKTARYNPLGYVRRDDIVDLYDDLQRIASMLYPSEGKDPFWANAARSGFIGLTGYIAETEELPLTMGEVLRQAAVPDCQKYFKKLIAAREATKPLSVLCKTALNDFIGTSDNTFQSIRKTISAKLELWLNPRIDAATSANDFDLRELRRRRMSIYLGVTPDNLERLAPLLNLFFQQAVDLNIRTLPEQDPTLKYQVMLMMDEFAALGIVSVIVKGIAYVAGYGLRIVTILQSPSQIRSIYGPDEAKNYMTNHAVEVVYTPKELEDATHLSERFGYDTVKGRSQSRSLGFSKSSKNETTSDQRRALMLPQELILTPMTTAYVIKGGVRPIKAAKIFYYKEPAFKPRLMPAPVVAAIGAATGLS
ncbi:type IV secretory system conjugative DNA transfer family protein, partial [Bradyrhizobium brasilense]|uniref:type IV secretory system conjugative DNA transfer family protein n=1 Tax=Bradyrhizobium brasilense TaxID=1419277 RepID=UPI001E2E5003